MRRFWAGVAVALGWMLAGTALAEKEKPPLVLQLEQKTGLALTIRQREKIAELSRRYAGEVRDLHAAFLADVSRATGLSQKALRERIFTEMSPSFLIDERRREAIEALSQSYLSLSQKRELSAAVERGESGRAKAREAYAAAVAAETDVPVGDVLEFLHKEDE